MLDVLDVISHKERIFAEYMPVFSAEEHKIIGYEVIGNFMCANKSFSLHDILSDINVPDEYHFEIEDELLQQISHEFKGELHTKVFINQNPNYLIRQNPDEIIERFHILEKKNIPFSSIVLQIEEHSYSGDHEELSNVISFLKTFGFQIAIKGIGIQESHLERIAEIVPHMIQIDLSQLTSFSLHPTFHDVLHAIGILAHKMGSDLLYENIATFYQFEYAWRNGGRYYAGTYLAAAERTRTKQLDYRKEQIQNEIQRLIGVEKKRFTMVHAFAKEMEATIESYVQKRKAEQFDDEFVYGLTELLNEKAFRIYVCDGDGFQTTSNIERTTEQKWTENETFKGKNWGWRPYFLSNVVALQMKGKGRLSDTYRDLSTGQLVRTFSIALNEKQYLFIDISHDYLLKRQIQ